MNVDVSTDIVIDRPPETVAHYASDPDHVPDWYTEHQVRRMADSKAAHCWIAARMCCLLPRASHGVYTFQIMEFLPNRLVVRTTEGPFRMEIELYVGTRQKTDARE